MKFGVWGVFEGADFKNRIHFFVESIFGGLKWVLGSPVPLSKSDGNRKLDRF